MESVVEQAPEQGGSTPAEAQKAQKDRLPLHAARIEDYALIGDCETAALVSREGSIDWLCWPSFDCPAVFTALLGTADHGYWKISPCAEVKEHKRAYRSESLIVETGFVTESGEVCVSDFMPPREKHSDVVRIVRGERGRVKMRMELAIRFDYGRTVPWVTNIDHSIRAIAGPDMVVLRTDGLKEELHGEGRKTVVEFEVGEGEEVSFILTYASSMEELSENFKARDAYADTEKFWGEWMAQSTYKGDYQEAVKRSLTTLKAMTYRPSGGIVAAITTSLPEKIGGERNWDYRYCWLRDTSFTLLVLMRAGYMEEAIAWRRWLLRAIAGAPEQIQAIYGIRGDREMTEWSIDWLPGYENSQPVRVGNGAVNQFQLDVYGEVAAALSRTPEAEDDIRLPATEMQAKLVDRLCDVWHEPDEGIWETRGGRQHFVHSKVMAWVAVDRAIKHWEQHDGGGDIERWRQTRDEIHREVCEKGFNAELNSFVQAYGSKELDASCLRIGLTGFLPMDDPRIVGTIEAIEKGLTQQGLVLRYNSETTEDGLPPCEGVFLPCSFWLVTCLFLIGREDDAKKMFERLLSLSNDVGLLSEEYDPNEKRMLGNFPQALSHIALVHTAFTMAKEWVPEPLRDAQHGPQKDARKG